MPSMSRKQEPSAVLAAWTERDLTTAAAAGELSAAFEVEETLDQVRDLIEARRHPFLVGESGVGKTAVVHDAELRQPRQGTPLPCARDGISQSVIR